MKKNGLKEIIESGKAPGIVNNTSNGFVDLQMPRHWGKGVTEGGFAKNYNEHGQPVYSSNTDLREAIAKAQDHGENVRAVPTRDL